LKSRYWSARNVVLKNTEALLFDIVKTPRSEQPDLSDPADAAFHVSLSLAASTGKHKA
jgi:hypothetical protein